ncbi:MAG: hypothetical protein WCC86_10265 [Methanoregula sp.]|uniref:hypothetical protein n=1 Tax=Methanoregula sp. TaxID=2052170 RepID=UPI003BB1E906
MNLNRNNLSNGLLDNFVTALAYDNTCNLWIGYAGGVQIYDGSNFQTITRQELLKVSRSGLFSAGMMVCGWQPAMKD